MESTVAKLAQMIWDYHRLNQKLRKSDCLLVLGSHDILVAERAADLFLQGWAKYIIFTGGFGKITKNLWEKTEAEVFADIAMVRGIPRDKILIENKSSNTSENMRFTQNLLMKKKLNFESFIIVTKPYMERRVLGMFRKQWPDKAITVTSPQVDFVTYLRKVPIGEEEVINLIVGDFQRVDIFPKKGYSIFQKIPQSVRNAYNNLVEKGYVKYLLKD